jgi:RNA:NAD 2'-phosphotransferase (TPT1/KptA family)
MAIATTEQAIEIIKMQSYRYPVWAIVEWLQERNISTVVAYHVSKPENAESIKSSGIKRTGCYERQDAVYMFLDYSDVARNGENVTGCTDFVVFTVEIPAEIAATLKDDGLYNGTFKCSRSAARLEQNIPVNWIK